MKRERTGNASRAPPAHAMAHELWGDPGSRSVGFAMCVTCRGTLLYAMKSRTWTLVVLPLSLSSSNTLLYLRVRSSTCIAISGPDIIRRCSQIQTRVWTTCIAYSGSNIGPERNPQGDERDTTKRGGGDGDGRRAIQQGDSIAGAPAATIQLCDDGAPRWPRAAACPR